MKLIFKLDDKYRGNYSKFEIEFEPKELDELVTSQAGTHLLKLLESFDETTIAKILRGIE